MPGAVLILAGGSGTRFWPASRRAHPKHLLRLLPEGKTLLQATVERAQGLGPDVDVRVVTAEDQREAVVADLDGLLPAASVLAEPAPRNTAPAIVYGVSRLLHEGLSPDERIVVLPADAWIQDEEAFARELTAAAAVAQAEEAIVTVGIEPTHPATGYGYLQLGGVCGVTVAGSQGSEVASRRVTRFCEKPDRATAEQFLAEGEYLWNAGIFVMSAVQLSAALSEVAPELTLLWEGLHEAWKAQDPGREAEVYLAAEARSFDYAVMEKAARVFCVRASFAWSDLGSWDALAPLLEEAEDDQALAGHVVSVAADRNVVFAPGKTVGLVGVEDLVVVVTDDAVLVARASSAQDVRAVTDQLREAGREDLL